MAFLCPVGQPLAASAGQPLVQPPQCNQYVLMRRNEENIEKKHLRRKPLVAA
jgi:hypothetical protein